MDNGGELLDRIFANATDENGIISDPDALTEKFFLNEILYRNEQLIRIGSAMAPALKNRQASNLLLYGPNGSGKSAVAKLALQKLEDKAQKDPNILLKTCYTNYRKAGGAYKVIVNLCKQLEIDKEEKIPVTGLQFGELFSRFSRGLNNIGGTAVIVIDEIDECIRKEEKNANNLLYDLSRPELSKTKIAIIGIANHAGSTEILDPSILSSLNAEDVYFPPYNAKQLTGILNQRVPKAFSNGSIDERIINLCAGLGSSVKKGDARKTINLLRVAAERAIARNSNSVTEEDVREAYKAIEFNRTAQAIRNLKPHEAMLAISIMFLQEKRLKTKHTSGEVYAAYCKLCGSVEYIDYPLSQRRIQDFILQMEIAGIVTRTLISKGRYGRTYETGLAIPNEVLESVLREDPDSRYDGIIEFVHHLVQRSRRSITSYTE